MKKQKIIYWIIALVFSAFMLMSAFNFLFNTSEVSILFENLGFPDFLVIPLGIAKILGVVAILSNIVKQLKELAFAGFFFDFILAFVSHIEARDNMFIMPVIALALLLVLYYLDKKVNEGY